ncbi:hypothetical protein GS538_09270 [Rhodococcus hoagii]|nr:hypothetical protein [Prescottella equi]
MSTGDSRQLIVIANAEGAILGASFASRAEQDEEAGVAPLPGQSVHIVDLPEELQSLDSAEEILRSVMRYRFTDEAARIEPRRPGSADAGES